MDLPGSLLQDHDPLGGPGALGAEQIVEQGDQQEGLGRAGSAGDEECLSLSCCLAERLRLLLSEDPVFHHVVEREPMSRGLPEGE
jgi:hypothetical protein